MLYERTKRNAKRDQNKLSFEVLRAVHDLIYTIKRISCRTIAFNSSSLPQAIIHWNGLPEHIVKIRSPEKIWADVTANFFLITNLLLAIV